MKTQPSIKLTPAQLKMKQVLKPIVEGILKEEGERTNTDADKTEIIKKAMVRVGLKSKNKITKDNAYPNTYVVEYGGIGIYSLSTFKDLERLTGARISFKPNGVNDLYVWFSYN